MTSVSTWAQRRAMAPAARRERAVTCLGKNPSCGPIIEVVSLNAWVMSVGVTAVSLVPFQACANGVTEGAPCWRRCNIRRTVARTGQRHGDPEAPKPMTSPRTPFFCVVNSRVTNVADWIALLSAVNGFIRCRPFSAQRSNVSSSMILICKTLEVDQLRFSMLV